MEDVEIYNMSDSIRKVWVDGDACPGPIKRAIIEQCREMSLLVSFVISYAHFTEPEQGIEWVVVDSEAEAVDLYVMNHSASGDVAVTQDYGLASILMKKGVTVIHPRGYMYSEEEMDRLLFERYLSGKERRAGHRTKGPAKFLTSDVERFCKQFKKIVEC
ncbi:hypothetical protein A374_10695 [Fictibacillus macauensis ZFHKF-1]|uniref:UPF0178 protein A374_10695 n=1 Tax=Fictibacillus macauensis ZFHKF-1 TaxID=1196324 RepID=I8UE70_9BACL|nr:DUF188 domain-containing protein [Fictibacillus macauensis]EIT85205.1 hypothetical protein A374_10695 [Fictibacillus macauensis ZFHKF-1]